MESDKSDKTNCEQQEEEDSSIYKKDSLSGPVHFGQINIIEEN